MGVLPLQFKGDDSVASLAICGDEQFDICGPGLGLGLGEMGKLQPRQDMVLVIRRSNGERQEVTLQLRVDTPVEADYLHHGGILPFVLRDLIANARLH